MRTNAEWCSSCVASCKHSAGGRQQRRRLDLFSARFHRYLHICVLQQLWILILLALSCITPSLCQSEFEYPPYMFTQQPQGGSPEVQGNTKVLLCASNGLPRPVYSWTMNQQALEEYTNITDTSLKIQNIQRTDAGEYQCTASNHHGAILSNRVTVHVAYMIPFANAGNQEKVVDQGQARVIDLPPIESYPQASIQWFEQQGQHLPIPTETQRYHVSLQYQLVILESRQTDNNKLFKAMAVNSYTGQSSDSQTFVLKVQAVGSLTDDIAPEIVVPPRHTTAVQGDDPAAVLECIANARSLNYLSVNWYRRTDSGRTLIQNDAVKYLLSMYRRRLTIKAPVTADSGVYECEASFQRPGGPTYPPAISTANLTVQVKPSFATPPPTDLSRDYGSVVTIPCQAVGVPAPRIVWYRNVVPVNQLNDNRYQVLESGTIEISDVRTVDSGMYQCFASNDAGEVNAATWLKILSSPPEITERPQDLTLIAGDSARFPCEVAGAPRPDVRWYRVTSMGNEDISGSAGRIQLSDEDLRITQVEVSDSGRYTCNATNNKGIEVATATLTVLLRTRITEPPQDSRVVKGSKVEIKCGVTHDAAVQVNWVWYHNDGRISVSDERRTTQSDGTLQIVSVRNEDIGNYRCSVHSVAGNDTANADVQVIELPYKPIITGIALNSESNRAVDVRFIAGFDGNSPITKYIVQYRLITDNPPGNWILADGNVDSSTTSYTVPDLRPAMQYQFRVAAVNEVGEGSFSAPSETISLPQQPPSGPPRGVVGSPRSESSIIIQWQAPDQDAWNGPLLGYMIRYKPSGYPDTTIAYEDIENTMVSLFELKRLIVFQEYEVAVAAYNAKGVGVYSGIVRVRTQEGKPTQPPRDVSAAAVSSTQIRMSWLPPDPQHINGINQGYKIKIQRLDKREPDVEIEMPSDMSNMLGMQTYNIEDLKKFTDYKLSVLCYTSKGDGPASNPVLVKTQEDVPDPVASLAFDNVLDTSLQVHWEVPPNINGILTGYTLTYEKKGETITRVTRELGPLVTNYTISGLTATTHYTIVIYAKTRVGNGPPTSADIQSGIPPEMPGPPRNLAITNIQADSVLLQFIPGFHGYTSISKWIVEGQINGGENWVTVFETSKPDATSLTVSGLRPYTGYKLRLLAENIAGKSPPSEPTRNFQTIQAAPSGPPPEVTVRAVNETAIRVRWKPLVPEYWNGEGRGYRIQYKSGAEEDFAKAMEVRNENANSYTFINLEEWTEYDVRVAAFNQVGTSAYSSVATDRTIESVPSVGPSGVNATAMSSSTVSIKWSGIPALQQNGEVIGYKILFTSVKNGQPQETQELILEDPTARSTILASLDKYTQYLIQVLGYTRIGDGVPSNPKVVVRTSEDVPGPPVGLYFPDVTASTAQIRWSPPLEPNGIIAGYKVTYREATNPKNYAIVDDSLGPTRSEFYVSNLQRSTYYIFTVSARTRLGWGEEAEVKVLTIANRQLPTKPGKPSIGMAQIGARWVTINWDPPLSDGNAPIRNYSIKTKLLDEDLKDLDEPVPFNATSFTIDGLKPNSKYQFKVAAANDMGLGPYSDLSDQIATKQAAPDSPPLDVKVVPKTTTSVFVTWKMPPRDMWNGDIHGYHMQYVDLHNETADWKNVSINSYATLLQEIDGLLFQHRYMFEMQSYNILGTSDWSLPYFVFMEPPPAISWNGDPLGYQVWFGRLAQIQQDEDHYKQVTVTYPTTNVELTNLQIDNYYEVKVNAFNGKGHGPFSIPVDVYVGEAVPTQPPVNLNARNISSTHIKVWWQPPPRSSWNGELQGYKVFYWPEGKQKEELLEKTVAGAAANETVLDNLMMYTEYCMVILAFNAAGNGPNTTVPIKARTEEGVPESPGSLKLVMISVSSINVTWIPPTVPNGIITKYEVSYHLMSNVIGASHSFQVILPGDTHYFIADTLRENVKYTFKVRAMTRINWGPTIEGNITTGPQLGSPEKPERPTLEKGETSVTIRWNNAEHGSSPISGYIVQSREKGYDDWETLMQISNPHPEATVSFYNLKPNKEYQFRIIAVNGHGISEPSPESAFLTTLEVEKKPFYQQWWFLVIVALTGVILIIIVISLLCLTGRRKAVKYKDAIPKTTIHLSNHVDDSQTHIDEDAGFSTIDARSSQRRSHRKPPRVTPLPPYTSRPPRPSPGSVNYSDEETKFPDEDSSSLSEKPSDLSDDNSQASESDAEEKLPPPPFTNHNHYVNGDVQQSWPRGHTSHYGGAAPHHSQHGLPGHHHHQGHHNPAAAYSYTDSEADSNYAVTLNGGHIIMNNMAGSRAPLPGFSSFV